MLSFSGKCLLTQFINLFSLPASIIEAESKYSKFISLPSNQGYPRDNHLVNGMAKNIALSHSPSS